MDDTNAGALRPPIHLIAAESDLVASLALQAENQHPLVAAMLLEEIERAELHEPGDLPGDVVTLGSQVDFRDERTGQLRSVTLVLPAEADIESGKVSILTPIGAALYGLAAGQAIDWPDLEGRERKISIMRVCQPAAGEDPRRNA